MPFVMTKQPGEILPCVMDFIKVIPEGQTISEYDVVITDPTGYPVTDDILAEAPELDVTKVLAVVKNGSSGIRYKITFTATTTPTGYIFEEEVYLDVEEV